MKPGLLQRHHVVGAVVVLCIWYARAMQVHQHTAARHLHSIEAAAAAHNTVSGNCCQPCTSNNKALPENGRPGAVNTAAHNMSGKAELLTNDVDTPFNDRNTGMTKFETHLAAGHLMPRAPAHAALQPVNSVR
jgi:hypothetical protein